MKETTLPQRLTPAQKKRSQNRFLLFLGFNALSYAALAESVLVLYALKLNASDFQIGLLISYIHLTTVFMLLGRFLIRKIGASRTYGLAWFVRNLMASLLILAPWFYHEFSPAIGLYWLMSVSLVFFCLRSTGIAADSVLINDVTSADDRGRFIGLTQMVAYAAMLTVLIAVSFWLRGDPDFFHFQVVIGFGCVMGVIASGTLIGVNESVGPRIAARERLLRSFALIYRDKTIRMLILVWIVVQSGIQLLIPFQLLAVKNGYGFSDQGAIIFIVFQFLGVVAAGYMNSILLDRAGPRPVLFLTLASLALISVLWFVSPNEMNYFFTGALFFLAGYCMISAQITLSHYFLNIAPRNSVVNLSILITILYGIGAGLSGTFLGGGVLTVMRGFGLDGITLYKFYFLFVCLILLGALPMILKLKPQKDWAIRRVIGTLFSIREWQAMHSVQQLTSNSPSLQRAHEKLYHLGSLGSEVGEEALLEYLDSPLYTIRTAALSALDRIEFGPETARRLIEEVKRGEFTTAYFAADMLGTHRIIESVPVLREALESNDYFLEGKAMLSLARLGDTDSVPRILEIFSLTYNPRLLIHGARAVYHIGDKNNASLCLERLHISQAPSVQDEIMFTVYALLGWGEENFRMMTIYNRNVELGIEALNDEIENKFLHYEKTLRVKDREPLNMALAGIPRDAEAPEKDSEALIELMNLLVPLADGSRLECLKVLLEDEAEAVTKASPRLTFNLTGLVAFLYIEVTCERAPASLPRGKLSKKNQSASS